MSDSTVCIRVVDPSGAPVSGLVVEASARAAGGAWRAEAGTGADGVARLADGPPGPVTFRPRWRQDWVSPSPGMWRDALDLEGVSRSDSERVLTVVRAARLRVRVIDEAGVPFAGAAVLHGPRQQGWWASG